MPASVLAHPRPGEAYHSRSNGNLFEGGVCIFRNCLAPRSERLDVQPDGVGCVGQSAFARVALSYNGGQGGDRDGVTTQIVALQQHAIPANGFHDRRYSTMFLLASSRMRFSPLRNSREYDDARSEEKAP